MNETLKGVQQTIRRLRRCGKSAPWSGKSKFALGSDPRANLAVVMEGGHKSGQLGAVVKKIKALDLNAFPAFPFI